jgi:hypothetical protein
MKSRVATLLAACLALPCAAWAAGGAAAPPPPVIAVQPAPAATPTEPAAPATAPVAAGAPVAATAPAGATAPAPATAPVSVANAATTAARDNAPREAGEPAVKHTVIEGEATRIDELSVRGVTQRIVVTPKGRGGPYEIITGDGSRDLSFGANTSRGAAGRSVWRMLDF